MNETYNFFKTTTVALHDDNQFSMRNAFCLHSSWHHHPLRECTVLIGRAYDQALPYRRDGVVVRASASQSVDLGFISLVESYQKTLKNGIRSFPAWRSAHKG